MKRGDKVRKVTGDYHLNGILLCMFKTTKGKVRCVVEHRPGFLHIYSPQQLKKL